MHIFVLRPQWLPACGRNADGRCAVQHDLGENRDSVDDVLATVENKICLSRIKPSKRWSKVGGKFALLIAGWKTGVTPRAFLGSPNVPAQRLPLGYLNQQGPS